MLKYRLIFGPLMLLVAFGTMWADGAIQGAPAPAWLAWIGLAEKPLVGSPIIPGGLLILAGCIFVLIPPAAFELAHVFRSAGMTVYPWIMALTASLLAAAIYGAGLSHDGVGAAALVACILIGGMMATHIRHERHQEAGRAAAAAAATLLTAVYLGAGLGMLALIRQEHSPWVLLAVIFITKFNDIGAYTFGRLFGKHKLIPWLSPGKTWEGFIGGMLVSASLAALAAWLLARYPELTTHGRPAGPTGLPLPAPTYDIAVMTAFGLLMGVVGPMGDLTMSLLKRDAGVKDSGNSIPGFGGFMDVLDSPLLGAPVAFWFLRMAAS